MTEVSTPSRQTYAYRYDDTYNRVQKVYADGTVRNYIGELAEAEIKSGETSFVDYLFAGASRVATLDINGLHYNTQDHLGSTKAVTSGTGVIEQKLDYQPFGAERVNVKTAAFDTHFTYTDQEKDTETNLLYYGARYYDPAIGRFTQPDPSVILPDQRLLATPQYLNLYSYALNNPLKNIDPTGALSISIDYFKGMAVGFVQGVGQTAIFIGSAALNPAGVGREIGVGLADQVWRAGGEIQSIRQNSGQAWGEIRQGYGLMADDFLSQSDYAIGKGVGGFTEKVTEMYVGGRVLPTGGGHKRVSGSVPWQDAGISESEAARIQNATNKINRTINVVGSRARGDASSISDWDYVIENMNSAERKAIKNSLPRGTAGGEMTQQGWSGIDLMNGVLDESRAHVIFRPQR